MIMVRKTLKEISEETARKSTEPGELEEYLSSLINLYENKLSLPEKRLVLRVLLESLYYKASLEDPTRIANIYAHKLRNFVISVLWITASVITVTSFLGHSPIMNRITEAIIKLGELL